MKKVFACVLALAVLPSVFGQRVKPDLSMRRALYLTGAKTNEIDTKNDKYIAENGSTTLKKSDAAKCEADGCHFNLGFIALRTPSGGELSTYALIQVEGGGLAGNTVYFSASDATRTGVLPVKLAEGVNKVTFQIDPYKKTAESDEGNNSFAVTIVVRP